MDKQTSLTPFELELQTILDVPEPDAAFVQKLHNTILHTPQRALPPKKPLFRWTPLKWGARQPSWGVWIAAAVALAVLAIFLALGPQRVMAAARHWLGEFIPGVGFIDNQSSLRILDKPVEISLDGAAVAVEKAYTNASETDIQIHYQDDNRTCKNTNVTAQEYHSRIAEKVYLLLPDGRKLFALTPRFSNWGKFPPLPTGLNEVVLVVPPNVIYPCAAGDPANPGASSTFCQCLDDDLRWLIQLKFVPPPPGSVLPVVDNSSPASLPIQTATAQTTAAAITAPTLPAVSTAAPLAVAQPELVGKLVKLDDGYLFLAALKRDPNAAVSYSFGMNERHFQLLDATGKEIQVEEVERSEISPDVFKDFNYGDTLLLRTDTKQISGPLKLTFLTLTQAQYQFGKEAEFSIELGTNVQPGQHTPFQKSFDFIPGHPFTLRQVTIDSRQADALGVTLSFAGQGFETIQVDPVPLPDPPPQGGSSGQCSDFTDCFYTSTSLTSSADNTYRLAVTGEEHTIQGPWSLTFDLEGTMQ
jgi:hypothetical protein